MSPAVQRVIAPRTSPGGLSQGGRAVSSAPDIRARPPAAAHILNGVLRVSVVGNSGSGKTTIATALSAALNAPHLELDGVFHQPGWVPLEEAEFRRRVAEFVAAPRWVADGNYSAVQDLVWAPLTSNRTRSPTPACSALPRAVSIEPL